MRLVKKIQSFASADRTVKMLFLRAFFLSAIVKFTLVFLPFRKVLNWQGKINMESPDRRDDASIEFRKSLQSAMNLCDKYTFWKTECYTQALTAKIILNKKGIPGTVYIGFTKTEKGEYKGHAWLRSYDRVITGDTEKNMYTVHAFYS
jgi:Transglutaminase-like superfamily